MIKRVAILCALVAAPNLPCQVILRAAAQETKVFRRDTQPDIRRLDHRRGDPRFGKTLGGGVAVDLGAGILGDILSNVLASQPNRPGKCDLHWADRDKLVECSPVPGSGPGSCTAGQGFLCQVMINGNLAGNPAAFRTRNDLYECSCEAQ